MTNLSFCIPVYNEESILLKNVKKIKKELSRIIGINKFEIIIVDNGSNQKTKHILNKIRDKSIKIYYLPKRSLGYALKLAIIKSNYDFIELTAIDLPFGFEDLERAIKISNKFDIIFGSKAHKDSLINTSITRMISSKVYRIILRIFFNINIRDTQGSIFIKKNRILPIIKYCTESNAFFTSQLAIFSEKSGLRITEIPVKMKKTRKRKSKFNIVIDGKDMLISIIKQFLKLKLSRPKF